MPLPSNASDDGLHRHNCRHNFKKTPPQAWEFLFYIPNPNHPLQDDEGLSAHFCLVLPDAYKQGLCKLSSTYRAVALITRRPRSSTKSNGYIIFRPHTTSCTCPKTPGELETSVIDRVSSKITESPCHLYNRADAKNKGQFETWSWYNNSVLPIQAPKMVHVDCLHLMRPLTQPKFGLILNPRCLERLEEALKQFSESGSVLPAIRKISQKLLAKRDTPK